MISVYEKWVDLSPDRLERVVKRRLKREVSFRRGGGGGTPLCKSCRYVRAQRECFLSYFGLKRGINVDSFGLKLAMAFIENTRAE